MYDIHFQSLKLNWLIDHWLTEYDGTWLNVVYQFLRDNWFRIKWTICVYMANFN